MATKGGGAAGQEASAGRLAAAGREAAAGRTAAVASSGCWRRSVFPAAAEG